MPRALLALLLLALLSPPARAMHHAMSDADMTRMLDTWYAGHPQSPERAIPADAVIDTIFTGAGNNPQFDADHNIDTYLDTLTIAQGTTVLWQWVWGVHSTTNGLVDDPSAGWLWDHAITTSSREFSYTFNDVGEYPYFCAVDQAVMTGMIVVQPAVSAEASAARIGFVRAPFPNPSRGGVSFYFALREPGQARAEVFDAAGRLVARPLDETLDAGPHETTWDGFTLRGVRATPGVYYLRLHLPGYTGSQKFVLDR